MEYIQNCHSNDRRSECYVSQQNLSVEVHRYEIFLRSRMWTCISHIPQGGLVVVAPLRGCRWQAGFSRQPPPRLPFAKELPCPGSHLFPGLCTSSESNEGTKVKLFPFKVHHLDGPFLAPDTPAPARVTLWSSTPTSLWNIPSFPHTELCLSISFPENSTYNIL